MHKLALAATAALALSSSVRGQCVQDIVSAEAPSSSTFGAVVAVDGNLGISLEFNVQNAGGGWVHFYGRTAAGEWALDQTEAFTLDFIEEVALDAEGGRLAIGDFLWSPSNGRPGRVVLYTRPAPGQPWVFDGTLESPTPIVGSSFGQSLAWSGDQLIVSQPEPFSEPLVHVFERDVQSGQWVGVQEIEGQVGSRFGQSLVVEGDELLIGAPFQGANPAAPSFGVVFVYRRNTVTGLWTRLSQIQPSGGQQNLEGFGFKVLRDGDRLLAASPFRTVQGSNSTGRLTAFRRSSGGAWVEDQVLEPQNPQGTVNFGRYAALDGSLLLVGGADRIFPYRDVAGSYVAGDEVEPTQNPGFFYGRAIASDGELALVGDSANPIGSANRGRIEAYDFRDRNGDQVRDACQPLGTAFCGPATPNSTGLPSAIFALDTGMPLSSLDLAVEALPTGQFGYFLVSMDSGVVVNPGGSTGDLCIFGPTLARYSSDVLVTGATGVIAFTVDTTQIPQGGGFVPATAGETWNFQFWHRDLGGTSNFSDSVAVNF